MTTELELKGIIERCKCCQVRELLSGSGGHDASASSNPTEFRNSETKKPPARAPGRPPRPPRVVIQVRAKAHGKTTSTFSVTSDMSYSEAMTAVQELVEGRRITHYQDGVDELRRQHFHPSRGGGES